MRPVAALWLAALLLAGCTHPTAHAGESSSTPAHAGEPSSTPAPGEPRPGGASAGGTTDRVFLQDVPHASLRVGNASAPQAAAPTGGDVGSALWQWDYAFQAPADLAYVNATVWIRVPQAFVLAESVGFSVNKPNGSSSYGTSYWTPPAPLVEAGDHELRFSSPTGATGGAMAFAAGDHILLHLYTNTAYVGAPPPFYVLWGAADKASVATLGGAHEPAP